MAKSPEGYQPSAEETRKAEDMMTETQKMMSDRRASKNEQEMEAAEIREKIIKEFEKDRESYGDKYNEVYGLFPTIRETLEKTENFEVKSYTRKGYIIEFESDPAIRGEQPFNLTTSQEWFDSLDDRDQYVEVLTGDTDGHRIQIMRFRHHDITATVDGKNVDYQTAKQLSEKYYTLKNFQNEYRKLSESEKK